ncbi:MAG: type IV secretion system DNA-binding domain-containing protein [Candidatus Pacebacteria bacterium]|nr:type IV secretion system DNA-binding domain-containing protein [Candidatus Paceibacterota bacterium]
MEDPNKVTYFGRTNFRNAKVDFGIKQKDRTKHMYVIGKTGMGKTTLLENMAVQDIRNGEGIAIVDPHGSFAEKMLDYIPKERIKDVIYFNPADTEFPIAFNIMEDVGPEQRYLVASGLMGVFKKMWPDVWSARMEYILNNAILALLEYPDATLLGVNRMLSDKEYRKEVVANISDPVVKAFWEQEFAKYTDRFAAEATPAIQNKVGQFTSNPLIRNIIGQPKSSFDFRRVMDEKKIVIMNLSKGLIGELNSRLIGAMLITKIYLAAMSRASANGEKLPDFYLYVDEFQNFATESFKDILSEARKYGLGLILAHQYIAQMEEGVADAVFGNVGTHIIFRVGPADAEVLEKEFSPDFVIEDIVNLGFASIYLKLSIDGVPSRPFSAATLPPIEKQRASFRDEIIDFSRITYCIAKKDVEKKIIESLEPIENTGRKEGKTNQSFSPSAVKNEAEKEDNLSGGPELFEAVCAECGKRTMVPFQPDGKRPVYCQKHRPKNDVSAFDFGQHDRQKENRQREINREFSNASTPPMSLRELSGNTTEFKKKIKKTEPDFKGLRELLAEAMGKDVSGASASADGKRDDAKIIKPGDSVKF